MASKYSRDFTIPTNFPIILKDFTRELLREINEKGKLR
jgi:hypothetical protein